MTGPHVSLFAQYAPEWTIILACTAYIFGTAAAVLLAFRNPRAFSRMLSEKSVGGFDPPPSFARAVGVVGAAILTAFLWGLGALLIVAFLDPSRNLDHVVEPARIFIYAAAALFAPYTVNQLSKILPGGGDAPAAPAAPALSPKIAATLDAPPPL